VSIGGAYQGKKNVVKDESLLYHHQEEEQCKISDAGDCTLPPARRFFEVPKLPKLVPTRVEVILLRAACEAACVGIVLA
jgi:hypothetical protein